MASSLRGLASKKKQPTENQVQSEDAKLASVEEVQVQAVVAEVSIDASVNTSESVLLVADESADSNSIDAVQALESAVESVEAVPSDVSVEQTAEVSNDSLATKKTKKQNSKKKGTENQ
jgi:hypothetical protein